ncbi:hypothetical protein [Peredibacter starrii]|uniref:Uncharacterized protein n=1 Tax=Peredibacter starrii TaxID=28202 RepID=A0AAX4HR41_9BACT|nr:hypothetical protein [Peredibacter starrii]WPU65568.1 hypothetical protein SOO65_02285 [Peredibacter starrii]
MNKFLLALVMVPAISFAAIKSDSKGGGGGSVVACYTPDGDLKSVELLDVYEGKTRGLKFLNFSGDLNQDVRTIVERFDKSVLGKEWLIEDMVQLESKFQEIPRDAELELIQDAWPVYLPRGCKIKQLANYYNKNVIYIDGNLYDKMDYFNRLALVIHEVIYAKERFGKVTDSRYARWITALALSEKNLFTPIKDYPSTHICYSEDSRTVFMAMPLNEVKDKWRFSFINLNGHKIYSEKTVDLFLTSSPLSDAISDRNPSFDGKAHGTLSSLINPDEDITVISNQTSMMLSWTGSDPGDSFEKVPMTCKEFQTYPER